MARLQLQEIPRCTHLGELGRCGARSSLVVTDALGQPLAYTCRVHAFAMLAAQQAAEDAQAGPGQPQSADGG